MIPNIFLQTIKVVHNNHILILENLCQWRNIIVISQGLSTNVNPLMNGFLNWKYIYIQQKISQRNFNHFKMNSYLHPKKSPWKAIILSSQWKIRIHVIMILDLLCPVVWCLMTSSWVIWRENIYHIILQKINCLFTQIVSHIIYIYRGALQYFYWKKGTYECIEMPCEYFCFKRNKVKDYWTRVLINDTKSDDIDELVDHFLVASEKFHKQYIIMP